MFYAAVRICRSKNNGFCLKGPTHVSGFVGVECIDLVLFADGIKKLSGFAGVPDLLELTVVIFIVRDINHVKGYLTFTVLSF